MEDVVKYCAGAVAAIASLLAPIQPLIVCAMVFVGIDFVTGVAASYKRAQRANMVWAFESEKAWTTLLKLCFVMCGITLAWLIDNYIITFVSLNLSKVFTGFVCGVEFWSYLENASDISNNAVFKRVRFVLKNRVDNTIGTDEDNKRIEE